MRGAQTRRQVYRFGGFHLDAESGELRKNGTRIRLQDQPLEILLLLLDHAGELVTREQIQNQLWSPGTYVDYDNAINSAMRKLREALADDSSDPRFIETFARRGYRFIGTIDGPPAQPDASQRQLDATLPASPVLQGSRNRLFRLVFCGVLILAAAVGWWTWRHTVSENSFAPFVPVPLTANHGFESSPSFSPDGNEVAFSWDEPGDISTSHIYVRAIGTGASLRLTSAETSDRFPSWSPDGHSIAFFRYPRSSPPVVQVYVVPALGGAERLITEGHLLGGLSWSPDGRFLAIAEGTSSGTPELFLVRVDNSERLPLPIPPDTKAERAENVMPAFSPDGRTLLFTRRTEPDRCGLYLMRLTGDYRPAGKPRLLWQEAGEIRGSAWTTDGKEIVYSRSEDTMGYRLIRIRAQPGARPERMVFSSGAKDAFRPAIAPRGNRLAYTQALTDIDLWQVRPGQEPRSFASSSLHEASPQYSPDGKRVAFSSTRSGQSQIWTSDENGENLAQLTDSDSEPSGTPRWSPDGRWIAFDRQTKDGWRIFLMALDGGRVHRLTAGVAAEIIPSWSADGKWVYHSCNRGGRFEVWKAPAEGGGPPVQVTHRGGSAAFESPDGRTLYYTRNDDASGLWALPIPGGEEKQVLDSVWSRAFAVKEDGIYYIPPPKIGVAQVRFLRFATGKDREIAEAKQYPTLGLTVSPDRKSILFSAKARPAANIMIVDNFR